LREYDVKNDVKTYYDVKNAFFGFFILKITAVQSNFQAYIFAFPALLPGNFACQLSGEKSI
jgi:hypothetical protein